MTKSNFSGACDPTDPERHRDHINYILKVFKDYQGFAISSGVE